MPGDDATSRGGSGSADKSALFDRFYGELRVIAQRYMRGERVNHTLQPTALVNEAFLRLAASGPAPVDDRVHFLRLAARTMRRVLVDHARMKHAERRGGALVRVTLTNGLEPADENATFDMLELDTALEKLAALHDRQATVIDLRYFAGLTVEEVAETLGTSPRTVKGDTRVAMAWLRRELGG